MTPATRFSRWQKNRIEIDSCPWAGPRPLRLKIDGDVRQFVGRDKDNEDFLLDVLNNDLVILSAESGVGKTSMLEMALMPNMDSEGYEVFYCDTWTAPEGREFDIDRFFAEHFRERLDVDPSTVFRDALDDVFGSEAVLVLDQFEELIRYRPAVLEAITTWIVDAVANNSFKIVVSMRSEFLHKLRGLDDKVGPWDMAFHYLESVTSKEYIRELIESANDLRPDIIKLEAIDAIIDLWQAPTSTGIRPGLLDLHAFLYALYWEAQEREDHTIDPKLVDRFLKSAKNRDLFGYALDETIRKKLDLCEQATTSGESSLDDSPARVSDTYLIEGTRSIVERIVQQLSSGGYKLLREEWELAEKSLHRELGRLLGPTSEVPRVLDRTAVVALFRRMGRLVDIEVDADDEEDLLAAEWATLLSEEQWSKLTLEGNPWEVDRGKLSSGPMLGMHPVLILLEEFRRFHFGLQWLLASNLVRTTSPVPDQTMVSLIHDGFGHALDNWAENRSRNPASKLTRLTASKGEIFDWIRTDGKVWDAFKDRIVVNVRWRDCEIRASLKNTVFVNCDFRGSRFVRCDFEGVMFINCLLDGASVIDSAIIGSVNPFAKKYSKRIPPSFEVELDVGEVELLGKYRGDRGQNEVMSLISHTSGMPAVPFDDQHRKVFPDDLTHGQPWRIPWERENGGLAMYGGRLCSLMVRRTKFIDGGTIALRLVSGSALDLIEHAEGQLKIDIFGSAIRGLTVTGPATNHAGQKENFQLSSVDAVLVDVWFGDGMVGKAEFEDTIIWQMMSLSEQADFTTEFSKCSYYGLVNVGDLSGSDPIEKFSASDIKERSTFAREGARMDYQSDPARGEHERRKAVAPDTVWPPLARLS